MKIIFKMRWKPSLNVTANNVQSLFCHGSTAFSNNMCMYIIHDQYSIAIVNVKQCNWTASSTCSYCQLAKHGERAWKLVMELICIRANDVHYRPVICRPTTAATQNRHNVQQKTKNNTAESQRRRLNQDKLWEKKRWIFQGLCQKYGAEWEISRWVRDLLVIWDVYAGKKNGKSYGRYTMTSQL